MITRSQVEQVTAILNELLELDRAAISKVFVTRHLCQPALEESDLVIVRDDHTVGVLGIFNGILDIMTDAQFRISAEFDVETNLINRFHTVVEEDV